MIQNQPNKIKSYSA